MFNVDFKNPNPQIICHDQYKPLAPKILDGLRGYDLRDHFILFSSGTTGGDLKGYAVSKAALFANAKAVNQHFALSADDVWALSLPSYHIGGLSVLARAQLLGNRVVDARGWDPERWSNDLRDVTITTIVPTQLYDLVRLKKSPSPNLRYVVVGGDFLSEALKVEALKLGWPVIRTFGMSEVCSQLASTKTPASNDLEVLPIHEIKVKDKRLLVRSSALFTLEFTIGQSIRVTPAVDLCDEEGFYITKDQVDFSHGVFKHLGRIGDDFKIAGHLVDMSLLRNELSDLLIKNDLFGKLEFAVEDDERKGKKLVLLTIDEIDAVILEDLAKRIAPVKIDEVRVLKEFARTDLGKLKKQQ